MWLQGFIAEGRLSLSVDPIPAEGLRAGTPDSA